MKVLLINPPTEERTVVRDMAGGLGFDGGGSVILPPLDLAYMGATLLNKGNEVKILDSDVENYSSADIYQFIQNYNPETIISTVSLPTIYEDCSFLENMRKCFSGKIIAKTNITYPLILKEILERSKVDLCIYGECDINIDRIITQEEKKNTAYLKNSELKIEENSIITNLNELPLPARNLLPNEKYKYVLLGDKTTIIQTSRGCPFPCAYYCAYPLIQGKKWRARSPEHVLREIEDIVNNHQIKKILFRDATFTLDKTRTLHICNLIIQQDLNIEWWCETRVDCLDEELIKQMRCAGCLGMNIGVETGDEKIMEQQAKIGLTLKKLKNIRKITQNLKMKLHFLLMIGLPGETKQSLYKTYSLLTDLKPETMGVCIVTPYPGTPLYNKAKEKGWIDTEDWTKFDGHTPVMHTDRFSLEELKKAREMLYRGFSLLQSKNPINWIKVRLFKHHFKRWASH